MLTPKRHAGFTIVELLIVIVVIGILAAITIVAFNGVTNKAKVASLQTDTANAAKAIEAYKATSDTSAYPATLTDAKFSASSGNTTLYTRSGSDYCVQITNSAGTYNVTNSGQAKSGACTITNLAVNPSLEVNSDNWYARWYGNGGGAGNTSRTSVAAKCGTQGLRKQWTSSGGFQDIGYGYKPIPITGGQNLSASVALRASFATTIRFWVEWTDSSGASISVSNDAKNFSQTSALPANQWTTFSMTVSAPAGATNAELIWGPYPFDNQTGYGSNIPVNATLDTDCLIVAESNVAPNYADGNSISSGWSWTGAANQSTSKGPAL